MRGAFLPVLAAALTPFLVFTLLVVGPTLGLVEWQPPKLWTVSVGTVAGQSQGGIDTIAADSSGIYVAGFVGCRYPCTNQPVGSTFLSRYDSDGHQVWSHVLGNADQYTVSTLDPAGDDVYIGSSLNLSSFVRRYDVNGNEAWMAQFTNSIASPQSIYIGPSTVSVVGIQRINGTDHETLETYGLNGSDGQTRVLIGSGSEFSAVDSDGIFIGRSAYSSGNASVQMYDLNGMIRWTSLFDVPGSFSCVCSITGVSATRDAVYVNGLTIRPFPGHTLSGLEDEFIRKYDLNGNTVWTIEFTGPGSDGISSNTSGVYVGGSPSLMGFGPDGKPTWSVQTNIVSQSDYTALASNENAVYVGGVAAGTQHAALSKFPIQSSLLLFGVNPPTSFALAGSLGAVVALSIFWLWRQRKRRGTKLA